jgi:hypothetical protein
MDLRLWSVGPRVKAAAHTLHYGLGVPVRKLPAVLRELKGVSIDHERSRTVHLLRG